MSMVMVQSFFPECLQRKPIQSGALPAISRVITPLIGIITPFRTIVGAHLVRPCRPTSDKESDRLK